MKPINDRLAEWAARQRPAQMIRKLPTRMVSHYASTIRRGSSGTLGPDKGIGFFARTSISPSDRNLISFYLDGGIQVSGFSAERPDDRFGIAMTYARISDGARGLDRDVQLFTGIQSPIRDFEAVLEMTYLAMVAPGVAVQPVFQYVMHPAGGAVDPNDATQTKRIKDAAVFGVRTTINF